MCLGCVLNVSRRVGISRVMRDSVESALEKGFQCIFRRCRNLRLFVIANSFSGGKFCSKDKSHFVDQFYQTLNSFVDASIHLHSLGACCV